MKKVWKKLLAAAGMTAAIVSTSGCMVSIQFDRSKRQLPQKLSSADEKTWCWHKKCIKDFFYVKDMPVLDITKEQLEKLANETVNEGITIPGVQKKLSLHLSCDMNARLTIVDYPTGYILKPQTEEFKNMPEFEDLAMRLAEIMGIQTVPHALIKMNDEYAYITKRIDRNITGEKITLYAMEDFCQLSRRLTQDKYRGSYENC